MVHPSLKVASQTEVWRRNKPTCNHGNVDKLIIHITFELLTNIAVVYPTYIQMCTCVYTYNQRLGGKYYI